MRQATRIMTRLSRCVQIINGRWAMLGAAGCVAPEVLGGLGVIPDATNILWYKTSVFPPAGTTSIYWADPFAIFWVEVVLMQVRMRTSLESSKLCRFCTSI
jgi:Chlorophyll A-B binding protein